MRFSIHASVVAAIVGATALAGAPAQAASVPTPDPPTAVVTETQLVGMDATQRQTTVETSERAADLIAKVDDRCSIVQTSYITIEGDPDTYVLDPKTGAIVKAEPQVIGSSCTTASGAPANDQVITVPDTGQLISVQTPAAASARSAKLAAAPGGDLGTYQFGPLRSTFVATRGAVTVGAGINYDTKQYAGSYNARYADSYTARATGPANVTMTRSGGPNCHYSKVTAFPRGYNFHHKCPSHSNKGNYTMVSNASWPIGPRAVQIVTWSFRYQVLLV